MNDLYRELARERFTPHIRAEPELDTDHDIANRRAELLREIADLEAA